MNCHYLILWSVCGVLCVQQRLFWYVVCCECSNDYFGVWCAINAAMIILVCGVLWVQQRLFWYVVCYECSNDYFVLFSLYDKFAAKRTQILTPIFETFSIITEHILSFGKRADHLHEQTVFFMYLLFRTW